MKRVLLFALLFTMCFSLFAGTLSGDVIGKYYERYQDYEYYYGSYYLLFYNLDGVISWNAGYYTDEFGDNTDEAYLYYIGKGSYTTESAVDSSTFYYIITDDNEGISFYLLSSYGANLASNSIKGTFTVSYKVDSITTKASGSFSTKKAVLTDANASDAFRNALESGKDIKVIITQDGTVLESKKFNLGTINNSSYQTAWDKAYCYTIIYEANGLDVSIATDKIMKGESVELNDCSAINKNMYEFIEWNTSSDGKGQSYKAGEIITPNKNLTLYAQWRQSEFNIRYDNNGGKGTVNPQIKHRGEAVILSQGESLSKELYELVGWNTQADGKGVTYKPGDSYLIDEDSIFYAVWRRSEFNIIRYDNNGGTGTVNQQIKHRGEAVILSQGESLSKELYELVGWNTQADGKGVFYKIGATYAFDNDVVLYAQWEPKKGPAGGYIFYDCDADNDSGNADGLISTECGWRYLEAAPKDLESEYCFGYYKTSKDGKTLEVGTDTAIGTGKSNTEALVGAIGETAWTYVYEETTWTYVYEKSTYAAKACADYSITVDGVEYDDWFLPSKEELGLMYANLKKVGLGSFETGGYWSSSEYSGNYAWIQNFYNNGYEVYGGYRGYSGYVRPVRAF